MVTDTDTNATHFVRTVGPTELNGYGKLWDKFQSLKKENAQLKKQLSSNYLTKGNGKWR